MTDERDCEECIFHDVNCRVWSCNCITREEAKKAVEKARLIEKTREEIAILIEQLEARNLSDQLIGAIKVCSIFCRNLKKEDDDELQ